jgi:hypothetical protein
MNGGKPMHEEFDRRPAKPLRDIPTRHSLLLRIRDAEDQKSWQEFFAIYAPCPIDSPAGLVGFRASTSCFAPCRAHIRNLRVVASPNNLAEH